MRQTNKGDFVKQDHPPLDLDRRVRDSVRLNWLAVALIAGYLATIAILTASLIAFF